MPLSSVEGRLWPDVGEVDITPALYAHEAEYAIPIAAKDNVLSGKPGIPRRPAPPHRNPSRALRVSVFARPVADSVEHDVG